MNEKKSFYVIGMSCAGCAANIQQALSERKGVIEARVNFAASDVIVEYNPALVSDKDLQKTVQEAGYDLLLENETEPEQAEILQREAYDKLRRKTIAEAVDRGDLRMVDQRALPFQIFISRVFVEK